MSAPWHRPYKENPSDLIPSDKEYRIIQLVRDGLKNREIAESLDTSEHFIKNTLRIIYDRLGFWNRVELALWYEEHSFRGTLPKRT